MERVVKGPNLPKRSSCSKELSPSIRAPASGLWDSASRTASVVATWYAEYQNYSLLHNHEKKNINSRQDWDWIMYFHWWFIGSLFEVLQRWWERYVSSGSLHAILARILQGRPSSVEPWSGFLRLQVSACILFISLLIKDYLLGIMYEGSLYSPILKEFILLEDSVYFERDLLLGDVTFFRCIKNVIGTLFLRFFFSRLV